MTLLSVAKLSKRFGGLQAVADVSFDVAAGSIKALIGPNGAGKTTLFNLVSGALTPDSGTVLFDGTQIQGWKTHRVAARGLARTYQHIRLFPHMTALENVMVGRHVHGRAGFVAGMLGLPWARREERLLRARALEIMRFLDIEGLAGSEATSLAYGQQRIVEIGRALAQEPRLLLLDEPAAGLNMRETVELGKLISRIRDTGVTVLLVEHDMGLVMSISDEIAVLSYGQKIADDVPLQIQRHPDVIRAYLGEEAG